MDRDSKTGFCLGEAYDWRSRRTWAVFLGSAASMGLVGAFCVWVVEVVVVEFLAMAIPEWARALLLCATFFATAVFLAHFADRHRSAELDRQKQGPVGSRRFRWKHERRSRWELQADAIWLVAALLVYFIAAKIALGLPIIGGAGESGFTLAVGVGPLVATTYLSYVAGLLDRWAPRNSEAEPDHG